MDGRFDSDLDNFIQHNAVCNDGSKWASPDIVQVVRNISSKECGKIVWESKYTKAFAGGWIAKLKADQQEAGADIAVLATVVLPKEIKNFGPYDGVWVTDFGSAMGLAAALRMGLINAAREKVLAANHETMKDHVYRYITGPEFTMQVRVPVFTRINFCGRVYPIENGSGQRKTGDGEDLEEPGKAD